MRFNGLVRLHRSALRAEAVERPSTTSLSAAASWRPSPVALPGSYWGTRLGHLGNQSGARSRSAQPARCRGAGVEPRMIAWRRDIHQNPELGNQERRTSGLMAQHLRRLGYEVRGGVAVTGVVAVLHAARRGPVPRGTEPLAAISGGRSGLTAGLARHAALRRGLLRESCLRSVPINVVETRT